MIMDATATTDQILSQLCEAINEGMNRFEQTGKAYGDIIEEHRDEVDKIILGKDAYKIKMHRARMREEGKIR
jgi:hypothetical protein